MARPKKDYKDDTSIAKLAENTQVAIERNNPSLNDVLLKDYLLQGRNKQCLAQFINLVKDFALENPADYAKSTHGCIYENFLSQFMRSKDKIADRFYRPSRGIVYFVGAPS